jgi:hypothetical protein
MLPSTRLPDTDRLRGFERRSLSDDEPAPAAETDPRWQIAGFAAPERRLNLGPARQAAGDHSRSIDLSSVRGDGGPELGF